MIGSLISRPEDVAAALEEDPQRFADEANGVLEGADPLTVLGWAGRAFGKGLVITASMGDTVLAHLTSRAVPGTDMLFVDTGYHFAETIGTAQAVQHSYPLRMLSIRPKESVEEHEARRGKLWQSNPDACCAMRKVAPLDNALRGYRAWATGLRRVDSPDRAGTPVVRWDAKRDLLKLAPIAAWTDEDVQNYQDAHPEVLSNPLLQMGYRSIGCSTCTRAVAPGEDARAGRWAGRAKSECGIHL
ncbi:phosphoadenylyl-sulfate reductase [Kineosporia sp. J2-2]|uniref:Adenosine 5'-phosphosulfate reductase n=1 Tax=Kineosporia corallincola TaxID=2835133 RepID=A0ABS5TH19_9ACTN|nr:phosphoadenylyl-sulfate reductase [Kineosporia corallincola]MBT0770392.1 phosphoadenylyl-sulfate reductase [Kineosporia corallincola]